MSQEKEIITPEAELREKIAKEERDREKNTKTVKKWVEVFKRIPHEDGKVLLFSQTNNGYKHSWYVGRESKCQEFLKKAQADGLYKPQKAK